MLKITMRADVIKSKNLKVQYLHKLVYKNNNKENN